MNLALSQSTAKKRSGAVADEQPIDRKIITLIAAVCIVMYLPVIPMSLYSPQPIPLGLMIASVAIGVGLLKRRKLAYHAFNVVAACAVLVPLFMLALVRLLLLSLGEKPESLPGLLFPFDRVPLLAVYILFYLFGLIAMHPARIRKLFR